MGRYLINLTKRAIVGEFRVNEPVLNIFFLPSIYKLILVGAGRGNSVVDSRL